jgi:dihydroorotate dehydrogenase (NAD+) catalytic subunit
VRAGGAVFGADPQAVYDVTAALRIATTLPLIVKLSPNTGDVRPTAIAAIEAGAEAVSLINTITSMRIDVQTRKRILANGTGGLSGPAVKPIALRMVYEVAQELKVLYSYIPIIGLGGICNANDAIEFLMAGASAIEIGTANFVNPRVGVEIVEGIEVFLEHEGVKDIKEIVGAAL